MSKKGQTLSKKEEEQLLGRITREEKEEEGPLRRRQIQKRTIKTNLNKLSDEEIKNLLEDRDQGVAKSREINLMTLTEYFFNDQENYTEYKEEKKQEEKEKKQEEKKQKEEYRGPEKEASAEKLKKINNMSREEKYNFVKKNTYINPETDDEPPAEQVGNIKDVWRGEKKYYRTKDTEGNYVYRKRGTLRRRQDNAIVDFVNENKELKEIDKQINKDEEEKKERKRGRPKKIIKYKLNSPKLQSEEEKKSIEKRFGFKPLEGEELKKFRGERESRLTEDGKQEVINFIDEEAEAKGREEITQAQLITEAKNYGKNLSEFINDDVEETSDLLNTNQNIMGVNEMKTNNRQQDIFNEHKNISVRTEQKYNTTPTVVEQLESKYDNTQPTQNEINEVKEIKNDFNNPIYNSSMVDNSNYQESRENTISNIIDLMQSNGIEDLSLIQELENLNNNDLQNIFNDFLNLEEKEEKEQKVANPIAQNISRVIANPESESVLTRLRNISQSSRAQAVAQATAQGFQQGGVSGAIRGGAVNIGQQIGQRYGGQIGAQIGGQVAQMGISDILSRFEEKEEKEGKENDAEDLIRQINNINDQIEKMKEPTKYPEMRQITPFTFPGPSEQRSNVKLVQNSITGFLNDVNLYGSNDYEDETINLYEV